MIVAGTVDLCAFLTHPRSKINLAADDGMDALCLCLFVEPDSTIHNTVIGDGDRIHPQFLCAAYELLDPTRAVQQTVFGMHMQMGKGHSVPPFPSFHPHHRRGFDMQKFSQISWYAVSSSSI